MENLRISSVKFPFFFSGGTIIDVETDKFQRLTCFGYVTSSFAVSCIKDGDSDVEFFNEVNSKLASLPRPFFAFYKSFEEKVLGVLFDVEIQKRPFEKKKFAIRINGLRDPFLGDGYLCMDAWSKFLESGNDIFRQQILNHNLSCLLQEMCLMICKEHREDG